MHKTMRYARIMVAVLRQPSYALLCVAISWLAFTVAVWWQSFDLIMTVLTHASLGEALLFMLSQYGRIASNFTLLGASLTSLIALLFGLQVTLLVYYVARARQASATVGATSLVGIGGMVSGVLGIGCAACGTFVLTSVLGLAGAGTVASFLPLSGQEFGIVGVCLLLYANYLLLNKLSQPFLCPI